MKERERLALVLLFFGQIEGSKVLRMGVSPFSMISKNSLLDLALAAPYLLGREWPSHFKLQRYKDNNFS